MANIIGGPSLEVPSHGFLIDVLENVWKMALFGARDSTGKQFADMVNQMGGNVIPYGHSGGASSVFFDSLWGRFNANAVSSLNLSAHQ